MGSTGSVVHSMSGKVFTDKLVFEQIHWKDTGVKYEDAWKKYSKKGKHQNFEITEAKEPRGEEYVVFRKQVVNPKHPKAFGFYGKG